MIRRPPRSTLSSSSAASDVYKRQAYDRADNGTLTLANTYNTGGLGGLLSGSVVDHLASQASLTFDRGNSLLYAVNAGSNTVSVFSSDAADEEDSVDLG